MMQTSLQKYNLKYVFKVYQFKKVEVSAINKNDISPSEKCVKKCIIDLNVLYSVVLDVEITGGKNYFGVVRSNIFIWLEDGPKR